jgi:preprotein translocase SecE subunit
MEFINNTIQSLNPANVNWSDLGDAVFYVLGVIVVIALVGSIIFSIVRRDIVFGFLKSTYEELKKVEWLGRGTTVRYSILTITMIALFMMFIVFADEVLLSIRNLVILG